MKNFTFILPTLPTPNGKGYEVLVWNRINYMKRLMKISVIIVPPLFSKIGKIENNSNLLSGVSVEILHPKISDYFVGLYNLFTRMPLQVSLHTRLSLHRRLICLKENYCFVTSRCLVSDKYLSTRFIIDFVDSMYLNFTRRAKLEKNIFKKMIILREANLMFNHEKWWSKRVQKSICVSKIDAPIIGTNCISIPLGVTISKMKIHISRNPKKLVFSGNLSYAPNEAAIKWFLENCWLDFLRLYPHATFTVVGRNAGKKLINILKSYQNVFYVGEVKNMLSQLKKYDIAIAPMVSGSGMQFKILEAMSVGLPVVTTTLGLGDISAKNGEHLMQADTPKIFIEKLKLLIYDNDIYKNICKNSFKFVKKNHLWVVVSKKFVKVITQR